MEVHASAITFLYTFGVSMSVPSNNETGLLESASIVEFPLIST